jgi:hypothetical protein
MDCRRHCGVILRQAALLYTEGLGRKHMTTSGHDPLGLRLAGGRGAGAGGGQPAAGAHSVGGGAAATGGCPRCGAGARGGARVD